jgi:hypothetical protein
MPSYFGHAGFKFRNQPVKFCPKGKKAFGLGEAQCEDGFSEHEP